MRERERERVKLRHIYNNIISIENLLVSWQEFLRGKRKRKDVAEFSVKFLDNIVVIHRDLKLKTYGHSGYQAFKINDPKPRDIHKASVRDRLVHHAIYRILYPYFDRKFIYDSYSCRLNKGTHRAINHFRDFGRKVSKNNTRTCWILKCDVRKFFANIDHQTLKDILAKHIKDKNALWLLSQVIDSFNTKGKVGVGLPLGNLTSQLLVNIYMNEFDQFAKRKLKIKYYIRYADDFVILDRDREFLEKLITPINNFLNTKLKISLHPDKIIIRKFRQGIDFLGYVGLPYYRILRTGTKKRMFKRIQRKVEEFKDGKISEESLNQTIQSYFGILSHGDSYKLRRWLENKIQIWLKK